MTLRNLLRKHYEGQQPSPDKLHELESLLRAADARRGRRRIGIGIAALVAVAAGLALFLYPRGPSVAEEIAGNHRKAVAPSFLCGSYGDVHHELERLDFDVIEPKRLEGRGYSVTGARYCSLQGRIAAQLKLETGDGKTCTLYQVRNLEKVDEGEVEVDGLRILIWREGEVLLGLCGGD